MRRNDCISRRIILKRYVFAKNFRVRRIGGWALVCFVIVVGS
jgi:hypothetical protein